MREFNSNPQAKVHVMGNASVDLRELKTSVNRSIGGSARNEWFQIIQLGRQSDLYVAIGNDPDGHDVLDEVRGAGRSTHGVAILPDRQTLVYRQIDNGTDDVSIEKNDNAATDAHTLDMILESLPQDLTGSLVQIAGFTRKSAIMDRHFDLEDALDQMRGRGATIGVDPGRAPTDSEDRLIRSKTFVSHARNLARVDFWAMNEEEFMTYFEIRDGDMKLLTEPSEESMKELVDKYIMERAQPSLICVTLGKTGLYLSSSAGGSTFVTVPQLTKAEKRTHVGLGDSTKAGMIVAALHESDDRMSPAELANMSTEQLRRIAAFGSAVSTYRMLTESYGTRSEIASVIDRYGKHFAEYGITPDYLA